VNNKLIIAAIFTAIHIAPFAQTNTEWTLFWSDEFSAAQLNTEDWTAEIGGGGWGNNELQYYTGNASNVSLVDGKLNIVARQESFGQFNYTSARIITNNKMEFQYGKVEARMKIPEGSGLWAAFWMLGANIENVSWPQCGEIDIMEHINEEQGTHGTVHWNNNGHVYQGGSYALDVTEFHIYGIIWDEERVRFFIDGIFYYEFVFQSANNSLPIFQKPFFLILNMAVGGNWPGSPNDPSVFPATMEVDYVRVYQQLETSVESEKSELSASVYPVPFGSQLNLVCPTVCSYSVYSAMGELILSGNTTEKGIAIETQSWAQGVYFIHILNEKKEVKVLRAVKN
jgi:beta-glucanase (GH16 family)